jgi:hypothetical protein
MGMIDGPNEYGYVNGKTIHLSDVLGLAICRDPVSGDPRLCPEDVNETYACVTRYLKHRARQIEQANWRGSDKWFHCMGMCEATQNCGQGAGKLARLLGEIREWWQNRNNNDPINVKDSKEDLHANDVGISGASSCQGCEDVCNQFNPNPDPNDPKGHFDPGRWPSL